MMYRGEKVRVRTEPLTFHCTRIRTGFRYVYAVGIAGNRFKIRKRDIMSIERAKR